MSHLKTGNTYFAQGSYNHTGITAKNCKRQVCEITAGDSICLNWADVNGMDQLSELYHNTSPYAYVTNNPIRFTDPDGRCKSDLAGNFPSEDCAQPIEEVVVGVKPKKNNQQCSSIQHMDRRTFFLSDIFAHLGSGTSGGGGGGSGGLGGGGGGAVSDEWAAYRKKLEAYRLAQSRTFLYLYSRLLEIPGLKYNSWRRSAWCTF